MRRQNILFERLGDYIDVLSLPISANMNVNAVGRSWRILASVLHNFLVLSFEYKLSHQMHRCIQSLLMKLS